MKRPSSYRLFIFSLTILVTFASDEDTWNHRKLTTKTYGNDLAYVKAEGKGDIIHYLFSGDDQMSILSIKSTLDGVLNINTTFSPPLIEMTPNSSVLYSFGIVFNQLIEYNDSSDTASINSYAPETWKRHSTSMEIIKSSNNNIVFARNFNSSHNATRDVTFSFKYFTSPTRQDVLPHLIVTSNSTQMDFTVDAHPIFKRSRFALATSFISQWNRTTFSIKPEKSLDDEYTPGTFEVFNWKAVNDKAQSFLQWKPVCYFDKAFSTMTSTYVKSYDFVKNNFTLNSSLAYNYFATKDNYNITSSFISFGRSEDKFYNRKNYTIWSATIGYGVPPAETVSVMAIAIISVGLGIPVLMFVGGGIYLCLKRRRSGYQPVFGTIST